VKGFERFALPVRAELAEVEERIADLREAFTGDSALRALSLTYVQPAAEHLFRSRGKLLRPLLVLLAARSMGPLGPGERESIVRTAAAVELIHTASLAHDDMVDSAGTRRGGASLHAAYGSSVAVLVGDLLYARFFKELLGLTATALPVRVKLLESFLTVTERMCEGEILEEQLRAQKRDVTLDVYLHLTEAKTAQLIAACCSAGCLLNGGTEAQSKRLFLYGKSLGLLFQISDDSDDGDGIFRDVEALSIQAQALLRAALDQIKDLPGSDALEMLRDLPATLVP
jgi:geranylgeranyl pyrophosphate synthase